MQCKMAGWAAMQAMLLCMLPFSDGSSRYDSPALQWPASRAAAPAVLADAQADELQACLHSRAAQAP